MNKNRPVNLDLSTIKLPLPALVSITHRISGMIMLGGIVLLVWMLDASLASEESFVALQDLLAHPLFKFVLWAVLSALAYHLVMGVRHIVMDLGFGESLAGGTLSAKIAVVVAAVLIVAAGGWILW